MNRDHIARVIVGLISMSLVFPTQALETPEAKDDDKADLAQKTNPLADLKLVFLGPRLLGPLDKSELHG